MSKIVRQVAGIDVAQQELVVSFGQLDETLNIGTLTTKIFSNSTKGFKELLQMMYTIYKQQKPYDKHFEQKLTEAA